VAVPSLCKKFAYPVPRQSATGANGNLKIVHDIGESFRPILCRREREVPRLLLKLVEILTDGNLDR
jgi:hypothetical protein